MAIFASFVYGSEVYGSVIVGAIGGVDVLTNRSMVVSFTEPVLVDANLTNVENYTIEFADNPGFTDVEVREVIVLVEGQPVGTEELAQLDSVTITDIELVTDFHTPGQDYLVTLSNLTALDGTTLSTPTAFETTARRTKVQEILKHIPPHFDTSPRSNIRSIVAAMGLEDDHIGGSRDLEFP